MLILGVGPRAGGLWPVVGAVGWLACWSRRCSSSSGPVDDGWPFLAKGDIVGGGTAGVAAGFGCR